jgi:uncharacterized caspase-like protein
MNPTWMTVLALALLVLCIGVTFSVLTRKGQNGESLPNSTDEDFIFDHADASDDAFAARTSNAGNRPRGRILAVVVGVNDYLNSPSSQLRWCVNDARSLRNVLLAMTARPRNVKVLTNARATAANIKRTLENAANAARRDDAVVLVLSGHGSTLPMSNEADGTMEIFCPHDIHLDFNTHNVSDDYLCWVEIQLAAKGVRFYVVADACHSGDLTDAAQKSLVSPNRAKFLAAPPSVFYTRKRAPQSSSRDRASLLLAGCRSDQVSYEYAEKEHGALTHALLLAFSQVGYAASAAVIHHEIDKTVRAAFPEQHPQLEGDEYLKSLPLFSAASTPEPTHTA